MVASADHSPFEEFFDFDMECAGGAELDMSLFEEYPSFFEQGEDISDCNKLMDLDIGLPGIAAAQREDIKESGILEDFGLLDTVNSCPAQANMFDFDKLRPFYGECDEIKEEANQNSLENDLDACPFFAPLENISHEKTDSSRAVPSYTPPTETVRASSCESGSTTPKETTSDASDKESWLSCPEKKCGQTFKRANALHRHVASIHNRSGEFCPFCRPSRRKQFNRSDNFQRHVTSQHKEVQPSDEKLQACLKRLYQGDGRRTCWRKSI